MQSHIFRGKCAGCLHRERGQHVAEVRIRPVYVSPSPLSKCFFYWCDFFYMIYIVQVKSMCVPILRSIGSELTKLENMQQLYVLLIKKPYG